MMTKFHLLLFWLSLGLCAALPAQKSEGIIQFEEKINMHRNLPPDAGDMKAMIPEFRIMKSELLFNANESLYRNVEEEEEDEEGDGPVVIKMQRPDAMFYKNLNAGTKTDQREFMGKYYLIEGELDKTPWKVGTESRQVLGYDCLKAVWDDTTAGRKRVVVAWFAPDIPVSSGPVTYGQLPGMILALDINNGELQLTAQKIETKALGAGAIVAPKKGEKTTQAEFKKMMDERTKAMGGSNGPGVRVIRN
ncbi:MAG: GLPGLI family protein [Saprospiraceae bacterium]|nr:GLPGLI family protein [Saprospiraceae bacterium]